MTSLPIYGRTSQMEAVEQLIASIRRLTAALEPYAGSARFSFVSAHAEPIPEDTYRHLVDLAKDGDEAIFKEYAQMVGVKSEHLDTLWTGTRARLHEVP
jgi:hypothetical protein